MALSYQIHQIQMMFSRSNGKILKEYITKHIEIEFLLSLFLFVVFLIFSSGSLFSIFLSFSSYFLLLISLDFLVGKFSDKSAKENDYFLLIASSGKYEKILINIFSSIVLEAFAIHFKFMSI